MFTGLLYLDAAFHVDRASELPVPSVDEFGEILSFLKVLHSVLDSYTDILLVVGRLGHLYLFHHLDKFDSLFIDFCDSFYSPSEWHFKPVLLHNILAYRVMSSPFKN